MGSFTEVKNTAKRVLYYYSIVVGAVAAVYTTCMTTTLVGLALGLISSLQCNEYLTGS